MHSRLRIACAIAAVAAFPGVASGQTLTNGDIRPPSAPFTETVFNDRVDDPYRWMEDPARAEEVTAFIRTSGERTAAQLNALPGRAQLRARVDAAGQAGVRYGDVRKVGDLFFYRRTDPGAQFPKLIVRGADGRERVLYDPDRPNSGGAINNYSVSPSGRTLAFHTAGGGGEVGAIRFMDVVSGRLLDDRLDPVWGEFDAAWLDDQTIAYTRMQAATPGGDQLQNMRAYVRRLGGTDGPALLGAGVENSPAFEPQEFPILGASSTSDWIIGFAGGARADQRIFAARRTDLAAGRPNWRTITELADQVGGGALSGDRLYLLSTRNAPNGQVLMLDLAGGEPLSAARVILPTRDDLVVTSLAASGDGVYILGQTDGIGRLFFLARGAAAPTELRLPLRGLVASLTEEEGGGGILFQVQDWFTAPRWFRAQGTNVAALGLDSASYSGIRGARQIREAARSADGTSVPMDVLLPPGHRPGTPIPMLLEAYGSYGANVAEPYYASNMYGLLESGGGVAFCGTRGGGERGRAWHEAGRSANKPNAHADLIACAERLVALGFTSPQHLTVLGTSAGGLLSPPAALRRPDLFAGLIANVAILNPTRLAVAQNGPNQYSEMGDPRQEAGYRALLAQDSYRMLETARDMPDTMLVVGLNDRRVTPWFSAKYAARALERFGDRRLVLIRTDPNAGHGIGSARDQQVDTWTDIFAFTLNRAGAEGFGTGGQGGSTPRP